jgi:hypothetical protein
VVRACPHDDPQDRGVADFFSSLLDRGAIYDYAKGRADFGAHHTYIPFRKRNTTLLTISGWSMLGAVLYSIALIITSRKPNSA